MSRCSFLCHSMVCQRRKRGFLFRVLGIMESAQDFPLWAPRHMIVADSTRLGWHSQASEPSRSDHPGRFKQRLGYQESGRQQRLSVSNRPPQQTKISPRAPVRARRPCAEWIRYEKPPAWRMAAHQCKPCVTALGRSKVVSPDPKCGPGRQVAVGGQGHGATVKKTAALSGMVFLNRGSGVRIPPGLLSGPDIFEPL
jgi:hypothetical protein